MTDFISTDPVVVPEVPAIPAKEYPLNWMDSLRVSTPSPNMEGRLEARFIPYRRVYAEDGVTVIAAELKTPFDAKDVKTVVSETLFASCVVSPEQQAQIGQMLYQASAGGFLRALAMAAIMESVNQEGMQQGVFQAPAQPTPEPTP